MIRAAGGRHRRAEPLAGIAVAAASGGGGHHPRIGDGRVRRMQHDLVTRHREVAELGLAETNKSAAAHRGCRQREAGATGYGQRVACGGKRRGAAVAQFDEKPSIVRSGDFVQRKALLLRWIRRRLGGFQAGGKKRAGVRRGLVQRHGQHVGAGHQNPCGQGLEATGQRLRDVGQRRRGMGHRARGKIRPRQFLPVQIEHRPIGHGVIEAQCRARRIPGETEGLPEITGGRGGRQQGPHSGVREGGVKTVARFEIGPNGPEIVVCQGVAVNQQLGDVAVETDVESLADPRAVAPDDHGLRGEVVPVVGDHAFHHAIDPDFEACGAGIAPQRDDLKPGGGHRRGGQRAAEAAAGIVAFLKTITVIDHLE